MINFGNIEQYNSGVILQINDKDIAKEFIGSLLQDFQSLFLEDKSAETNKIVSKNQDLILDYINNKKPYFECTLQNDYLENYFLEYLRREIDSYNQFNIENEDTSSNYNSFIIYLYESLINNTQK